MNYTPEQMRFAQEQMKSMSQEDILRQMEQLTPEQKRLQCLQMGISPEHLDSYTTMLKTNPSMLNNMKDQMNQNPNFLQDQMKKMPGAAATQTSNSTTSQTDDYFKNANTIKGEGNAFYGQKSYESAIEKYELAIAELGLSTMSKSANEFSTLKVACHCNIAACCLALKRYSRAVLESSNVLSMPGQDKNRKALYRRGQAFEGLEENDKAKHDYLEAYRLDKNDAVVKQVFQKFCDKIGESIESIDGTKQENIEEINGTGPSPGQLKADMLDLKSETMESQLKLMKSMPKDMLRKSAPNFANMSDAQIDGMISQMEAMVSNPVQFEKAKEAMKNLTPEQVAEAQRYAQGQTIPEPSSSSSSRPTPQSMPKEMPSKHSPQAMPNPSAATRSADGMPSTPGMGGMGGMGDMGDMAKMVENMSPEQLHDMMKMQYQMLESNPEMFAQTGMSTETLKAQMKTMLDMDPKDLHSTIKSTAKYQPAMQFMQQQYAKLQRLFGSYTPHAIVVILSIIIYLIYDYFFN